MRAYLDVEYRNVVQNSAPFFFLPEQTRRYNEKLRSIVQKKEEFFKYPEIFNDKMSILFLVKIR